ncbi:FecR domain-containing protein [Sphingobium sp. H33]|uniref:FecR domain-containing protein n=1 Tax=Sphingobium nicotianae TaxID=2782607 RepID=A0A9X1DFX3_9SPHN|nr:FecR domain-containing protein [Sphingobium nicotianae]
MPRYEAEDQAAAWDARLRGARATNGNHRAFQAWLEEAPENREAHERLQAALAALRLHANQPEMAALRDEARSSIRYSNRRRLFGAVAAMLLIILGAGIWFERGQEWSALMGRGTEYSTENDEQVKVTLADGSVVTLDSNTRLVVRLSPSRRDISMMAGHALFQVAKDTRRPFVVTAHDRTITALGTLFDVRIYPRGLRVTLAKGSVAIRPAQSQIGTTAILKPRQQFVETDSAEAPNIRAVDAEKAVSWADGQLFFDNDTLEAAAAEMNQYSPRHQIIVDPAVADIRISGMFHTNDPSGFVEALEATLPVQIRSRGDGRIFVSRRHGSSDEQQKETP